MNGASAVSGTKLDALRAAADLFVDQLALDSVHRVAMTQFNSAPVGFTVPEIPFEHLDSGLVGDAHDMIGSMSAGGSTNIIAGLDGGVNKLDVTEPYDRQVAVLFTDGKHNTPSTLADADLQAALESEIDDVDPSMELYSLGFGTSISSVALSDAANAKGGWHVDEVDSMGVAKNFSLVAAAVMDDSTLSDPIFTIKPGETRSHRIGVSRYDRNLTFVTHWDTFDPERVRTKIVPPDGEDCPIPSGAVVARAEQLSGENYRVARVNLPFLCNGVHVHDGDWQIEMTVSDSLRTAERVDSLIYSATDIWLNSRSKLDAGRLNIEALLGGAPLKDAKFTAYLLPPLPETNESSRLDELGSTPGGADSIPAVKLIPRSAIAVPLTVTGNTGDTIEASGTYSPTKKGLYQVRVVADLIDGNGKKLTRESTGTFYSPKAKWMFGPWWVKLIAVLVLILIVYVVFGRSRRKTV
jgi:hypothetical protein